MTMTAMAQWGNEEPLEVAWSPFPAVPVAPGIPPDKLERLAAAELELAAAEDEATAADIDDATAADDDETDAADMVARTEFANVV